MNTLRGGAVLAFALGLSACRATTTKPAAGKNVPDYVTRNAENAFAELQQAEYEAYRSSQPDDAWLIRGWTAKAAGLSHGKPFKEPFDYPLIASVSSGAVVLADENGRPLLRLTGPSDARRWETWRRGAKDRPADCPLSEGWDPVAVTLSTDRRKISFILPYHPPFNCVSINGFSWHMTLSAKPDWKAPSPAARAAEKERQRIETKTLLDAFDALSAEVTSSTNTLVEPKR